MAVTKRLRFEILRRDGFTCRYCGAKAPDVELAVDHVTPKALGGTDDPTNLATACKPCNAGKSSAGPDAQTVADVDAEALRWARNVANALDAMERMQAQIDADLDTFDTRWLLWTYTDHDGKRHSCPRPNDWCDGIESMLRSGLSIDALLRCMGVAMRRDTVARAQKWRYFCGVAWKTLRDAQQLASER